MEKLLTLSDLYREDVQGNANIILVYPTSASWNQGDDSFFFNKKWVIDDELAPEERCNNFNISSIHNYIITGDCLRNVGRQAPEFLLKHWERSLKQEICVRYGRLNEDVPHVEIFPIEAVTPHLHAVDPEVQYKLISKRFITEIPCSQAAVLTEDNMEYPCVLKICMLMCGSGVWVVHNQQQYHSLKEHIMESMPSADIITTQFIHNVQKTVCGNFYLSKKGKVTWLGVTESLFDHEGLYLGGKIDGTKQDELKDLIHPVIKPVVASLHKEGYFGVANVDVVIDDKGGCYVVDLNPRVGAPTKLVLILLYLRPQGYNLGMLFHSFKFKMSASEVISLAEETTEGKVLILNVTESREEGVTTADCYMVLYATDHAACDQVIRVLCRAAGMTEAETEAHLMQNIRSRGCQPHV